jgi:hypothetical protein
MVDLVEFVVINMDHVIEVVQASFVDVVVVDNQMEDRHLP